MFINIVMTPLIYQLNLPPLTDCILDQANEIHFNKTFSDHSVLLEPTQIFKTEFLKYDNIKWSKAFVFKKTNGIPGELHMDNIKDNLVWGINWIYGGYGLMEYWDKDDFKITENDFIRRKKYQVFTFTPTIKPRYVYFLPPGVYLVNSTKPHRATGFQNRYCVSYRSDMWSHKIEKFKSNKFHRIVWEDVVELFQDKIIDNDLSIDAESITSLEQHSFEDLYRQSKAQNLISVDQIL